MCWPRSGTYRGSEPLQIRKTLNGIEGQMAYGRICGRRGKSSNFVMQNPCHFLQL